MKENDKKKDIEKETEEEKDAEDMNKSAVHQASAAGIRRIK